MAKRVAETQEVVVKKVEAPKTRRPPATTPEAREGQLVSLAVEMVEEQLRNRTASSQVLTHYLKIASPREQLERERLQQENEMLKTKIEQIASGARIEELYGEALNAMRSYKGDTIADDDYDD